LATASMSSPVLTQQDLVDQRTITIYLGRSAAVCAPLGGEVAAPVPGRLRNGNTLRYPSGGRASRILSVEALFIPLAGY